MGERLRRKSVCPDLIVTSPAMRAQSTAELIAAELGIPHSDIAIEEQIYGASASSLIYLLQNMASQHAQVMLVGHNPTMTDLVNYLVGHCTDNLPTCAVATLEFDTDDWRDLENAAVRLVELDFPKNCQTQAS